MGPMDFMAACLSVALVVALMVLRWLRRRKRRGMRIEVSERDFERKNEMGLQVQEIQIHRNKIVDFAGAAKDAEGNDIELTNLRFEPTSSEVGTQIPDENPSDNNVSLSSSGVSVGATATLTMDADGADGSKREALVAVTIAEDEVELQPMTITFTERAA